MNARDVKVAIIGGAGFMGKAHSFAYSLADIQQQAGINIHKEVLVDLDKELARKAAQELGWAKWSDDWKEVVTRPEIDLVDIVTPPHTHAEIAIAAIAAGKHVLSEKPIANDSASAHQMWEAARTAGVANQVGFNYRHNAGISFARQLIAEGRIGEILQLRIQYVQDAGFGDLGWRSTRASGASGASGDIGSHIIDIAELLVGDIVRVSGSLVTHKSKGEVVHDVDDAGAFVAEFACGAIGTFAFNLQAWGQKNRISFEIDGTLGALAFDWNARDELQVYLGDNDSHLAGFRRIHIGGPHAGTWFNLTGVGTGYLESSANQIMALVRSIVDGRGAHPNFGEGAHVQLVVEAVAESSRRHNWVEVPPRNPAELDL